MTQTGELFLGIIAFSVMVMALIQIGAIYAGIRLARRVDQLAVQMDQEIKPLIANLTALSGEASRAATLAAKQAERLHLVAELWLTVPPCAFPSKYPIGCYWRCYPSPIRRLNHALASPKWAQYQRPVSN